MTLNTGDLHKGVTIEIDGVLFQLLDVHHIKAKRSAQVLSLIHISEPTRPY